MAVIAACGPGSIAPNAQVDGWSVGEPIACAEPASDCDVLIQRALDALDSRDPRHAAIVSAALYSEGLYPNREGNLVTIFRSSTAVSVAVFELADGTRSAIGVGNVLGHPTTFPRGPKRAP